MAALKGSSGEQPLSSVHSVSAALHSPVMHFTGRSAGHPLLTDTRGHTVFCAMHAPLRQRFGKRSGQPFSWMQSSASRTHMPEKEPSMHITGAPAGQAVALLQAEAS